MSTSWTTPDARRAPASPPAFGAPYLAVAHEERPPLGLDVLAGVLAAVVPVLVAAPVGLLWGAVAPRLDIAVADGEPTLVRPITDEFIAADGFFLLIAAVAGLVGGLVAWWLARAHGPAVVAGLFLGGLVAGYVAMAVGELVDRGGVQAAIAAGQEVVVEARLQLRAQEAVVAWPLGALLGYLGASFVRGR